jgi:tRNA-5-taurinomethyluridine 2-sulfurtransferase
LGEMRKTDVRLLAEKWKLPSARKRESMGLCFIGKKRKFADFICAYLRSLPSIYKTYIVASYIPPKPGPIVHHITGARLGTHNGLWNFTIGQGAKLAGMPAQMFVSRKDTIANKLYLVPSSYV